MKISIASNSLISSDEGKGTNDLLVTLIELSLITCVINNFFLNFMDASYFRLVNIFVKAGELHAIFNCPKYFFYCI